MFARMIGCALLGVSTVSVVTGIYSALELKRVRHELERQRRQTELISRKYYAMAEEDAAEIADKDRTIKLFTGAFESKKRQFLAEKSEAENG